VVCMVAGDPPALLLRPSRASGPRPHKPGVRPHLRNGYTGCLISTRMATQEFVTHSAEETIALGRTLAATLIPPKLVLLRGDLGAGKTTLVKGIAEAFQAASAEDVTSPTFTLIHEYRGPQASIYHIDLYRIDTPRQLETLGLDDLVTNNSILLIEWGEKFARFERERDVEIALERMDERVGQRASEPGSKQAYEGAGDRIAESASEDVRRIRITTP
jgi:tRNA threonylcarbamoyladenosine biosynthesis protein TsaE